ncbi:hypothetical protein [Pseudomonas fluorescens]|uniref:hypothetical protein n=1 Tax=Pseudomonas fluorescens TaxID=294 RepID=UPI003CFE899D
MGLKDWYYKAHKKEWVKISRLQGNKVNVFTQCTDFVRARVVQTISAINVSACYEKNTVKMNGNVASVSLLELFPIFSGPGVAWAQPLQKHFQTTGSVVFARKRNWGRYK